MTTIEKFARDMARRRREYTNKYRVRLSYRKSLDWAANVLFFANWKHLLEHKDEEYVPEQQHPINFVSNGKIVATVSSNSAWTFGPGDRAANELPTQHMLTSYMDSFNINCTLQNQKEETV